MAALPYDNRGRPTASSGPASRSVPLMSWLGAAVGRRRVTSSSSGLVYLPLTSLRQLAASPSTLLPSPGFLALAPVSPHILSPRPVCLSFSRVTPSRANDKHCNPNRGTHRPQPHRISRNPIMSAPQHVQVMDGGMVSRASQLPRWTHRQTPHRSLPTDSTASEPHLSSPTRDVAGHEH